MLDYLIYIIITLILIGLELLYFRIANHYNIIDRPNERSSHNEITLRGGGVIFPIAILIYGLTTSFNLPYFILGLLLIAAISFWDDLQPASSRLRILFQMIAVSLLFSQLSIFGFPPLVITVSYIVVIGIVNAYNFMDGINGITGLYSLVNVLSLLILNHRINFIDKDLLIVTTIALVIFLYFNFRNKARSFAGDVGSISIAFIIIFGLGSLMVHTDKLIYIMFLAVYGIDTVLTILARLFNGHNIFKPHRTHIYQLLSNERGFSQRVVAILYSALQLSINIIIISVAVRSLQVQFYYVVGILLVLAIAYTIIRYRIRKKYMRSTNMDVN